MVLVRIFIPLIILAFLVLIYKIGYKALKKEKKESKIEEKLEDLQSNEELYKKTLNIDVEEAKAEKKRIDEIENLEI